LDPLDIFLERSKDKLRASPERSEGEDQFSVACEGKFKGVTETGSISPLNLSEQSEDKLFIFSRLS
jgi:hypothetical protein